MPAGRPRKEIDQKEFEKLCGLQCTQEEIAAFFDCSADTIDRWCERTYNLKFAEVFKQKRGLGKISLRRAQMATAESGNATMLIWLGKQHLDQKDTKQSYDISLEVENLGALADMLNAEDDD